MKRLINLLLVCSVIFPALIYAQDAKFVPITKYSGQDTVLSVKTDTIQQKDLYDVIGSLFHKPADTPKKDSITSKAIISIVPAIGYTLQTKFAITLAGNIVFRMAPDTRISTIIINTAYTQTKQLIIPIRSDIWSNSNEYNFVGDLRYYKYPQSTYGLGSSSRAANEEPMDFSFLRFHETVLRHISGNFYAGAGYVLDAYLDIKDKGTINGSVSDYQRYGAQSNTISSGITLDALLDSRDNSINPAHGFYGALQYRDNKPFLGSTSRWQSLIIDLRKYYRFPRNSDNVIAFWSYDWLMLNGNPPYLDLPSNTWDPFSGTSRGYIQGRFRGAQMVYLETEYRFRLSRNGLFGGVLFVNGQSFSAAQGTRMQSVQPAFGPGVRIKLNKVSKTNIAIDYGMGRQGSHGVFVNVGEVF